MANANQIHLSGDYEYFEVKASGTIKPGYLCDIHTSTGKKVRAHPTVGGYGPKHIAVEDALQGNTIDDNYSSGDLVALHTPRPGAVYQLWLKAGENVAIGDRLMSAGDGTLQEFEAADTVTADAIVGTAEEAVDLSASGAVATRIDVRIA